MLSNLLLKEIRLQVPIGVGVLVLAAMWLLLFLSSLVWETGTLMLCGYHYFVLTLALLLMAPAAFGITADATERSSGVIDRQFTLPVSRRLLWTVKVAVVLALSLLLGVGVLLVFEHALSLYMSDTDFFIHNETSPLLFMAGPWPGVYVVLFAAIGLYASSLAEHPVAAVSGSIGIFLAAILIPKFISPLFTIMDVVLWMFSTVAASQAEDMVSYGIKPGAFYVRTILLGLMLLVLGYTNFRPHGFRAFRFAVHACVWIATIGVLAHLNF